MQDIATTLASVNWQNITEEMHEKGFSVIPNLLTNEQCEQLKENYHNPDAYRKR